MTGKLTADLMRAPGKELHRQQGHIPHRFTQPVFQNRLLRIRRSLWDKDGLTLHPVPVQPVAECVLPLRRNTVDHGEVFFMKLTLPNLLAQIGRSALCPRVDHHTAHGAIQPVHASYDRRRLAQRFPKKLRHPARFIRRENARGLDAHHDTVIFI